jgi:hypothetical protein
MRTLRIAVALGLIGILVSPVEAVDGLCKLALKGNSSVAKECVKGGTKAAKKEMHRIVDAVKVKTGNKPKCESCHDGVDNDRYDVLKNDGREQFDKMIASLK